MNKLKESDWKEDKIEFHFEDISDGRESRNRNKYKEKYESYGLGSNTYYIEKKLRKDKKELKWKEKERRGRKSIQNNPKMKYKTIDLINGYEEKRRWQIRMKINSGGKLWFWIETL